MATDQAAMADTDPERSDVMSVPGGPARRRRRQTLSQFPDRNRGQLIDIRIDTNVTTVASGTGISRCWSTSITRAPDMQHLLLVHEIEFYANRLLIEFTRAIEDLKYRHACSD
jgi:hypothetical protein